MDLNLIPLKLQLELTLSLDLIYFNVSLPPITIYEIETPGINSNIFNLNDAEPDESPPTIIDYTSSVSIIYKDSCNNSYNYTSM